MEGPELFLKKIYQVINYLPYYQKLGFDEVPPDTLATLKTIHRNHMLTIPFENLDIHYGNKITLSPTAHFEKLVNSDSGRGGFCYEMNGLFYEALTAIGFEVWRISARVADGKGNFTKEFGHVALVVSLQDQLYLCDVGFGESFLEPILIKPKLNQPQQGKYYRIIKQDAYEFILQQANKNQEFKDSYLFTLRKRELTDFADMCMYHQESPNSTFTQKILCSIAKEDGRLTLTSKCLIRTRNGVKDIRILENDEAFFEELYIHFGILLEG